jgi:hypothetical protein
LHGDANKYSENKLAKLDAHTGGKEGRDGRKEQKLSLHLQSFRPGGWIEIFVCQSISHRTTKTARNSTQPSHCGAKQRRLYIYNTQKNKEKQKTKTKEKKLQKLGLEEVLLQANYQMHIQKGRKGRRNRLKVSLQLQNCQ